MAMFVIVLKSVEEDYNDDDGTVVDVVNDVAVVGPFETEQEAYAYGKAQKSWNQDDFMDWGVLPFSKPT